MIELDIALLVSPLFSALLAAFGIYVALTNRLTKLETLMQSLKSDVEKHNQLVERTYKLESDQETQWHRHDELRERVDRLEDKI